MKKIFHIAILVATISVIFLNFVDWYTERPTTMVLAVTSSMFFFEGLILPTLKALRGKS